MFNKITTTIEGLFIVENSIFSDHRGVFRKNYSSEDFLKIDVSFTPKELYYSINRTNVLRGMHFQIPPKDHQKLVYVIAGCITDVCLDLRRSSPTYGNYFDIDLDGSDSKYLFIPPGIAHGFISRSEGTIVHYAQDSCYSKLHDLGVRFDSFGYDWKTENPIISERDGSFPNFQEICFF
jgi:dTDP-4-dehydrorhamnose 3,5-epimerase/CDP-3, 6-dideoxy-D-glycero-D-glycero-4-hexulose-5-epimerase